MDKARKPYPKKARDRIKATQIIDRLSDHVHGKIEMTATQINAARILLNKALPDLKAMEITGEIESKPAEKMTNAELSEELAALRALYDAAKGSEAEESGTAKRRSVH